MPILRRLFHRPLGRTADLSGLRTAARSARAANDDPEHRGQDAYRSHDRWSQARDSEMWIGDDKLYLRVQRTLANRERAAAAEEFQKHGPGRLEREGPVAKVAEVVEKAKRVARAQFHQRAEAAE